MIYITLTGASNFTEKPIESGSVLRMDSVSLTFKKGEGSVLEFDYKDGQTVSVLRFSMAWWDSWINDNAWAKDTQNSGDYIFRPRTGQYVPNSYS